MMDGPRRAVGTPVYGTGRRVKIECGCGQPSSVIRRPAVVIRTGRRTGGVSRRVKPAGRWVETPAAGHSHPAAHAAGSPQRVLPLRCDRLRTRPNGNHTRDAKLTSFL